MTLTQQMTTLDQDQYHYEYQYTITDPCHQRAPGCKGKCSRMSIIVIKRKRSGSFYGDGRKFCTKCERFMMWPKKCCPCCGCSLRNGPVRRNARRKLNDDILRN